MIPFLVAPMAARHLIQYTKRALTRVKGTFRIRLMLPRTLVGGTSSGNRDLHSAPILASVVFGTLKPLALMLITYAASRRRRVALPSGG